MMKRLFLAVTRRLPRLMMALNVGLTAGGLALWAIAYRQGLSWRADFTVLYTGSSMVIRGLSDHLYDFGVQAMVQQEILAGRYLAGGLLPFNYPPHLALIFAPLGYLRLEQAYVAWFLVQLGLLGYIGWRLWRHLEMERASVLVRCLVISAVAALPFVSNALILGALSLLMLVSWLGFALALRRGDGVGVAVWVVVMTLKPQVAVVPALILVVSQRGKPLRLLVGLAVAVLLVTSAAFGPAVWPGFIGAVLRTFAGDVSLGVTPAVMYTLRGTLASILGNAGHPVVGIASLVGLAASSVVVAWLWWEGRAERTDVELRIAFSLFLGLLFSLHAYPQDTVLAVVPCMLFGSYLQRSARRAALLTRFLVLVPGLFWVTERILDTTALIIRIPTLMMALICVWILHELMHAGSGGGASTGEVSTS